MIDGISNLHVLQPVLVFGADFRKRLGTSIVCKVTYGQVT